MAVATGTPRGVWLAPGFFAASGIIEIGAALFELPRPLPFWPAWEAVGRGLIHLILAMGLWERLAVCRSAAMVYCLAVPITYGVAIGLALFHAPLRYPPSLVVQSLFQIPSCVVLLPYLRSPEAALHFARPLFGR